MFLNTKNLLPLFMLMMISLLACETPPSSATRQSSKPSVPSPKITFQNKGHELVYKAVQKTGDYQQLLDQKNVEYQYTYRTADQKEDVSIEKYLFDGEWSLGIYERHERTMPKLEGPIIQIYDGTNFRLKHKGQWIDDEALLKQVAFTRKTNFYWFAMMQKLLDPGIIYEYLRKDSVDGQTYDVVSLSFDSPSEKPTDIYHLYINTQTSLIDQFLFTVADFNIIENPFLMRVRYEKFNTLLLPTYRKYTPSNWEGEVLKEEWVEEISKNVKFNQAIDPSTFTNP